MKFRYSKILKKDIVLVEKKDDLKRWYKTTAYNNKEMQRLKQIKEISPPDKYMQLLKCIDWTKEVFGNESELM